MLHIAFNTDSAYTRFCGVTMVSLLRHNRQDLVTFHILGRGLTPADKEALTILTDNFGQQSASTTPTRNCWRECPSTVPRDIFH